MQDMGLAADLSYAFPRANWFQRAVKAFAEHPTRRLAVLQAAAPPRRPGAEAHPRPYLDAPEVLAGLPVLDLTTTGRKSGQPRTSHLISIPIDDTLALLGTNFGQPATPAWVLNLEADPKATVRYRDQTVPGHRPAGVRGRVRPGAGQLGTDLPGLPEVPASASASAAACGSSCSSRPVEILAGDWNLAPPSVLLTG